MKRTVNPDPLCWELSKSGFSQKIFVFDEHHIFDCHYDILSFIHCITFFTVCGMSAKESLTSSFVLRPTCFPLSTIPLLNVSLSPIPPLPGMYLSFSEATAFASKRGLFPTLSYARMNAIVFQRRLYLTKSQGRKSSWTSHLKFASKFRETWSNLWPVSSWSI